MSNSAFDRAAEYIELIPKFTKKTSPEHTQQFLSLLGDPQENLKIIHVAGTNGKGSVCAYLESALRTGGYTTALFTSPHLIRLNERFVLNGKEISDDAFLYAFDIVYQAVQAAFWLEHPSYFEFLFLMAMVLFAKASPDIVILETGLGGRLDATNAVDSPIACAITSISLDHTVQLGDTLESIAFEKAGILKRNVPCYFSVKDEKAAEVIVNRSREVGAPIKRVAFRGDYREENAALAKEILYGIKEEFLLSEEEIGEGLKNMRWPGRMEALPGGIVLDGAHNEDGILRFLEIAEKQTGSAGIGILFSTVKDKPYEKMIALICERLRPDFAVTTEVAQQRGVEAQRLAQIFTAFGCKEVYSEKDPGKAYRMAEEMKKDGRLYCIGSLYLIGEIKKTLSGRKYS